MVNGLRVASHVYSNLASIDLCQDPDDNPILAIALECNADYLVTGDKRDLLSMRRIGLTPIVSARKFWQFLSNSHIA